MTLARRSSLEQRARRLVWGLVALGIGCALVNLLLLAVVLSEVDSAGDRMTTVNAESSKVLAAAERYRREKRRWIDSLLHASDHREESPSEAAVLSSMEFSLATISRDVGKSSPLMERFASSFGSLEKITARASSWYDEKEEVERRTAAARANVLGLLRSLRNDVEERSGALRLDRVTKLRDARDGAEAPARHLAESLLNDYRPAATLNAALTGLFEIALMCERLDGVQTVEEIANLRINETLPAMQRVSDELERLEAMGSDVGDLRDRVASLRGWLSSDESGQESIFGLADRQVRLAAEARRVHELYESEIDLFERHERSLSSYVQESMTTASREAAAAVSLSRRFSGAALLVSAVLTLLLGRSVARSLSSQARGLEQSHRSLDEAMTAADAANRAKSDFLANMSHEIRTPMTAILGYSELLLSEADLSGPDRDGHLQTIRRNADHLLSIINDILDLSKIEAGALRIAAVEARPAEIVNEVVELMRLRADAKHITLSAEFETGVPAVLMSDPIRLRQVLLNLVGNAIKFTETGSVRVLVVYRPAPAGGAPFLSFRVVDTGIGMTDEQLSRLFKPFSQADTSVTRRFGGTGLGLAISMRLAQMLGGNLAVCTSPGAGSTFAFTLHPVLAADGEMLPAAEAGACSSPKPAPAETVTVGLCGRVLLAEDGPDNQLLISHVLRRAGAEVDVVDNGRAAMEAALASHYDVVLMDMQMPVMDGYAAANALREHGYTGPIIALTAHAMADDRAKCMAAGCSEYMTKPINRLKLLQAIRALGGGSAAHQPLRAPRAA